MPEGTKLSDFSRRAAEIRRIAKGIFDKEERRVLLEFVAGAENLAAQVHRKISD